jgi:hypothetical protein
MRPRYQPPRNKQYFHTKQKIDKRDMTILKIRVDTLRNRQLKKELDKYKQTPSFFRKYSTFR